MDVGEVATPSTGDTNFFAELVIMINDQHPFPALARHARAHHACRTGTDDDHVVWGVTGRAHQLVTAQ